jgi:hypothetical protein
MELTAPLFRSVAIMSTPSDLIMQVQENVMPKEEFEKLSIQFVKNKQIPGSTALTTIRPGWKHPVLTKKSHYCALELMHQLYPLQCFDNLLVQLTEIFRKLSLDATYQDSPVAAHISSLDGVQCTVTIEQLDEHQLVLQVQRRAGCAIKYSQLARKIICENERTNACCSHSSETKMSCQDVYERAVLCQKLVMDTTGDDDPCEFALKDANCLLQSDRYDARQLGLETLVALTDLRQTCRHLARPVAKALLNGKLAAVLELAFQKNNDKPHLRLALCAVSNALHVLVMYDSNHAELLQSFQDNCFRMCGGDVCDCLLKLLADQNSVHVAYLAAQSLCSLCKLVPSLRERISEQVVEHARSLGCSCHAALETVTGQLLRIVLEA